MANELVKYANPLNELDLSAFTLTEKRFFFTFLSLLREKPKEKIELSLDDIRSLGVYRDRYTKRIDIVRSMDRMVKCAYGMYFHDLRSNQGKILVRNIRLFDEISYEFDPRDRRTDAFKVFVKLHPEALPFIEQVFEYTSFPLSEYQGLKSTYSQDLFIHLKQFRRTGKYIVHQEDLKKLLNVPKEYRQSDIDRRILLPAIKELRNLFPGLTYEKEKKGLDKRKVSGYVFTFQKEVPALKNKPVSNAALEPSLSIEVNGDLPDFSAIKSFAEVNDLPFSVYEAIELLLKKAKKEKIKDWKKYLLGCKENWNPKSKRTSRPTIKSKDVPFRKPDPELLKWALELEKEFNS